MALGLRVRATPAPALLLYRPLMLHPDRMFSIVVPAATLAIILTLFWAQHRARKLGVTATNYLGAEETAVAERANVPLTKRLLGHLVDLDAFGLLMFAAGWSCLLLPLTLVNGGHTVCFSVLKLKGCFER